MKFDSFYSHISKYRLLVFSFDDLNTLFPLETNENLKKALYRWRKKGWIASLKRGLYEISFPKDSLIPDLYIANRLYSPSYVSLETALSHYSIIPEISMAVTSITTKPTRRFRNKHGLFIYRTVKPECFKGYSSEKSGSFDIFMAEPEKALMDWLYFKTYRTHKLNLSEERLDVNIIAKLDKNKMTAYSGLYGLNLKEIYAELRIPT